METSTVVIVVGCLVLIAVCLVFGPLITIWALNTLFGFTIAYTFKTWLASLLVTSIFTGPAVQTNSLLRELVKLNK